MHRNVPFVFFTALCAVAVCSMTATARSAGAGRAALTSGRWVTPGRFIRGNPQTAPQALCVGGTQYVTTQDDEFSQDTALNYSPSLIDTTPQPNGAMWSSRAHFFASDNSRNNIGTDDAYYTDPTRGLGPYSPYSFSSGALHIKAVPVPQAYATAAPLLGAHWLSGLLESPAQTYGYVEVEAREPSIQGWFPAALWLLGLYGSDGQGNGYEELDVNEMFGLALPPSTVQQTQVLDPSRSGNYVRTVVSPDPGKAFHSYGVLWTPQVVRFFIDRKPTSPDFTNGAFGPANAIINLGVFTQNTWSPGPANNNPQIMSLRYYRWYQTTSQSCSPSIIPT